MREKEIIHDVETVKEILMQIPLYPILSLKTEN